MPRGGGLLRRRLDRRLRRVARRRCRSCRYASSRKDVMCPARRLELASRVAHCGRWPRRPCIRARDWRAGRLPASKARLTSCASGDIERHRTGPTGPIGEPRQERRLHPALFVSRRACGPTGNRAPARLPLRCGADPDVPRLASSPCFHDGRLPAVAGSERLDGLLARRHGRQHSRGTANSRRPSAPTSHRVSRVFDSRSLQSNHQTPQRSGVRSPPSMKQSLFSVLV